MPEAVDHPAHYGGEDNPFEVIKVLRAWDLELAKGFCWGNVIKYTARAEAKGGPADRRKAEWYATELVSIEAELATKPKPAAIPIILPTPGSYELQIDWNKRTYSVVNRRNYATGGPVSGGGAGGGASSVNMVTSGSGGGGGSVGGYATGIGGASNSPPRCTGSFGCVGGYHGRSCPLHKEIP